MSERIFFKKILCFFGIAFAVYIIIRYMMPLVVPFIFSTFLSMWLYPVVDKITKKTHFPYKLTVIITVLLLASLLFFGISGIGIAVFNQVKRFTSNMPFIQSEFDVCVRKICKGCDEWLGISGGKAYSFFLLGADYLGENWNEKILPFVTDKAWSVCQGILSVFIIFLFFLVGTWLIMEEYSAISKEIKNSDIYKRISPLIDAVKDALGGYFKTQGIIICVVTVLCTIGLFIIKNPYAILIGIIIAVLDAFPILGSGSILIPWTVIYILQGRLVYAAVIGVTYLLCLCAREFLEPKLMGRRTGLRPIYMIISFYAGIQLFGIIGVILGPIAFVVIKTAYTIIASSMD